ncbi:MAG: hypothetical protein JOY54_09260 [Acidobacteriaceae bacterium]|nr:hypothetical protein [Acidobacteriaceae bacterium]
MGTLCSDRGVGTIPSQTWSHSSEVSFIYPLGEEHGFDAIEQHVFQGVMGGMFSAP